MFTLPAVLLALALPSSPVHPGADAPVQRTSGLERADGAAPVCRTFWGRRVPCNPDFRYFGGKVIANVKTYAVFWNDRVRPDVVEGIGGFYRTVVNSEYMDWLNEYDTTVPVGAGSRAQHAGTNQVIGRGTFGGSFTLPGLSREYPACPVLGARTTCITDADVGDELRWQIAQGNLPPADDATLYVVHLPASVIVNDPTVVGVSCQNFCAYHSATTTSTGDLFYAVIPSLDANGCEAGCGSGTLFENTCASASHEIVEAMTDAQVGQLTSGTVDFPLAWYDAGERSRGEIGDLCSGMTATVGGDGLTGCTQGEPGCYVVQPIFSRRVWNADPGGHPGTPACVATRYDPAGDYSLALARGSLAIPSGASGRPVEILTQATAASSLSVDLAAAQLPPGVHAALDRTSVTAGDVARLTLSVDAGTPPARDALVVVRGSGAQDHSAALLLQIGYPEATPPAIAFESPSRGATLSGKARLQVRATAGDGASVSEIVFSVDGSPLASGDASRIAWDTRTVKDGKHRLEAMVIDSNGAAVSARTTVTVRNAHANGGCSAPGGQAQAALAFAALLLLRRRGILTA